MRSFTNSGVFYATAIAYAPISGITVPANRAPDAADSNIVIRLTLSAYSAPSNKPNVNIVTSLPLVEEISNTVYGGNAVSEGTRGLAKLTLEGFMDTPISPSTALPTAQETGKNQWLNYSEIIAICLEGRAAAAGGIWQVVNPLWFRDPYGRVFTNPRIIDFSANYIEAVPGRHNFTMTMVV